MAVGEVGDNRVRKSDRLPVRGCASVHWKGSRRRYTLDNLSLGGALMLGTPCPGVGQRVLAVLSVLGARPVSVTGKVIRVNELGSARQAFAVEFSRVPEDLQDLVTGATAELEQDGAARTVLLVARSRSLRAQLTGWLSDSGWRVVGVGTPVEAVAELDQNSAAVRWVIALDRLTQTGGTELLSYVSRTYPSVHRLLVSSPAQQRRARAAITEGIADAVLLQPIEMRRLADALGRCPGGRAPTTTSD